MNDIFAALAMFLGTIGEPTFLGFNPIPGSSVAASSLDTKRWLYSFRGDYDMVRKVVAFDFQWRGYEPDLTGYKAEFTNDRDFCRLYRGPLFIDNFCIIEDSVEVYRDRRIRSSKSWEHDIDQKASGRGWITVVLSRPVRALFDN